MYKFCYLTEMSGESLLYEYGIGQQIPCIIKQGLVVPNLGKVIEMQNVVSISM